MTSRVCAKCGQVHFRCSAHNRAGQPCGMSPAPQTNVCRLHGAKAPQVKAAAKRRQQGENAERAVQTFGLPIEIDPQTALLQELHRSAGIVAWLNNLIADLHESEVKQLDMSGKFEKPSVWVELYERERKHFAAVAKSAIDAGIEERRVALAESQGELIGQAIRNILGDVFGLLIAAGLAADVVRRVQREEVGSVVRKRLMEIAESTG